MSGVDLYLKQLKLGPMANFVYLIGSRKARQCYVVDPAWDIDGIFKAAAADDMSIVGALVSHFHPDHIGGRLWGYNIAGLSDLIAKTPMPVYAQKQEIEGIVKVTGLSKTDIKACASGDHLVLGDTKITLVHTPGHTPGSQCFHVGDSLVTGDTLFISGCGRVDLPGGDNEALYDSLNNKIKKMTTSTIVYPGHDYDDQPSAPLAHLLKVNPYLQVGSLEEWHHLRL